MFVKNKNTNLCFITGFSGFIGQRLAKVLSGHAKVLSRKSQQDYDTVVCDLMYQDLPSGALNNVDTIFHLAGLSHDMRDASKNYQAYYKLNVEATVKLANHAVKSGVKKFVFISSVKAGGFPSVNQCADECHKGEPDGVYGSTKREAELQLLKIGKDSGMHVSIIRPSLVYGPDMKGNLKSMLLGIRKGWFPPLPETNNRRSMIHVDDLVRAILLVAKDKRANGEIFIATDGIPHSSREIYNTMCDVMGKSIPKWSVPKIMFDIASLLNPSIKYKLNKLLGDECYSSAKLEMLGFKAKKSLKDMNETDF